MKECIHCNLCKKHCSFLEKYDIDLSEFEKRPELAYHCFLCGKCKEVCPRDIDGRKIAQEHRQKYVQKNGIEKLKSEYKGLLWEKYPYKFSNYRHANQTSVLFMGCNFTAFFPKTARFLTKEFQKRGMGVLFECCQKPVAELGLEKEAETQIARMDARLESQGVTELIVVCPNCYYFLRGKTKLSLVSIYRKLEELGIGNLLEGDLPFYYPCPDREEHIFINDIRKFLKGKEKHAFPQIQCCGLGGSAAMHEKKLATEMSELVQSTGEKQLYTYCASCISNFRRNGFQYAEHVLTHILGIEEKIPLGFTSVVNRARYKWK